MHSAGGRSQERCFFGKTNSCKVEQAKEVIAVAQRNSVKLMVGYPFRFNKKFLKAKENFENGLLGDVEYVHAISVGSGPFFHSAEAHSPVPVPDWWFNTAVHGRRRAC